MSARTKVAAWLTYEVMVTGVVAKATFPTFRVGRERQCRRLTSSYVY